MKAMISNEELKTLITAVRQHDRGEFARLYHELKKPVYTVLLRITRNTQDAEDLLQELFLRIYRDPPGEEVENCRAWIFACARNLALNLLRDRRATAELGEELPAPGALEEDAADRADISAALARLPDGYCEVVSLHIYAGLTFAEISKITGTPLGTLLWRYNRALSSLRKYLVKE